jgi:hypothetical protein
MNTQHSRKIPQTDAIFDNVAEENRLSDENSKSLRLSIDTKAKVKIGNLSRHGKARSLKAKQADDHDTEWQSVSVPFGILNLDNDEWLCCMNGKKVRLRLEEARS